MDSVRANAGRNNLDFASERHFKKRTHRAVDKAADQDFLVLGAAFALDKASGDFSGGIKFFVVFNSNRNVVHSFNYRARSANCGDYRSSGELGIDAAVGLLADFSGFKNQFLVADFVSHSFYRQFFFLFIFFSVLRSGAH